MRSVVLPRSALVRFSLANLARTRVFPLAFALVACAAGPVLPRQTQSSKYDKVELIAYRALTRDDFRAEVAVGFTIVEERRSRVQRLLAQPSSPTSR
jgi:hypothetical protein